jgi:hypothetical protein
MRVTFMRHPIWMAGGLGLAWGVMMRVWMRFVSTDPEFSWSGTGFILGASTAVGLMMGLAWLRRERRGRGWWRLTGLASLLVGGGAGSVMVPSFLLGALAFGRTPWRRTARVGLALVAAAFQVVVFATAEEALPIGRAVVAYPWYAAMITFEAWAVSIVFRPRSSDAPLPTWAGRTAVGIGLAAVVGAGVMITGIKG